MENNLENFAMPPYPIKAEIEKEVESFLREAARADLEFEESRQLIADFQEKEKSNPEYRLAYLRLSIKEPDAGTRVEMGALEAQLQERDRARR